MSKKRKLNVKRIISLAIMLIAFVVIVISAVKIVMISHDYKSSEIAYIEIADEYTKEKNPKETDEEDKYGIKAEPLNREWYKDIDVDMAGLKAINEDIVGWIYFENEDISYPVMYSGDNEEYLRKTYDGKTATAGSIFIDGQNSPDLTDINTMIYGHNMRNLSMFGKLRYYKADSNYLSDHQYIQIITENAAYRYKVIAYKNISGDSGIYYPLPQDRAEAASLLNQELIKGSLAGKVNDITEEDKLITLSTCSSDDTIRFVVTAKMIDEYSLTK